MKITYPQIQRIHGLLPATIKQDKDAKASLVYQFTEDENRCSVGQMTFVEANRLIISLGGTHFKQANSGAEWYKFDWQSAQHRKILSLCREYGWETQYKGKTVADMKALATWLKSEKSPIKKPIINMEVIELRKIIKALENMVFHKWQQTHKRK